MPIAGFRGRGMTRFFFIFYKSCVMNRPLWSCTTQNIVYTFPVMSFFKVKILLQSFSTVTSIISGICVNLKKKPCGRGYKCVNNGAEKTFRCKV